MLKYEEKAMILKKEWIVPLWFIVYFQFQKSLITSGTIPYNAYQDF